MLAWSKGLENFSFNHNRIPTGIEPQWHLVIWIGALTFPNYKWGKSAAKPTGNTINWLFSVIWELKGENSANNIKLNPRGQLLRLFKTITEWIDITQEVYVKRKQKHKFNLTCSTKCTQSGLSILSVKSDLNLIQNLVCELLKWTYYSSF